MDHNAYRLNAFTVWCYNAEELFMIELSYIEISNIFPSITLTAHYIRFIICKMMPDVLTDVQTAILSYDSAEHDTKQLTKTLKNIPKQT